MNERYNTWPTETLLLAAHGDLEDAYEQLLTAFERLDEARLEELPRGGPNTDLANLVGEVYYLTWKAAVLLQEILESHLPDYMAVEEG